MATAFAGRLDRGGFVDHARVVEQQQRPRLFQREALPVRPVGVEHARLAAADTAAVDEQHGDEIDAIELRPFRRRAANAVAGVDGELVRLDMQGPGVVERSEEHTCELKSLLSSSYAVVCLKRKI